uniref:alpha-glucosidase n=1 Tax=Amblyomma cajennense TaxID=34607 RepID=A0A023FN21_AMBCJ
METVENENYKPPHVNEDGLEREEAVTDKLVASGDGTKITFTNNKADGKDRNGDAKIEIQGVESQFVGLSKEELMRYANDPFWVRLRMALFVLFWILWVAMLVGAVAIIVLTPRCAPPPQLAWWQSSPVYNVEVASYADDSDGTSRFAGLLSKLDYIKDLGMRTLQLRNIFPSTASGGVKDYMTVDPALGSMNDVEALLNATKELDLHVVLEINPAFTSQEHEWFLNSKEGKEGFQDLFVWEGDQEGSAPEGVMSTRDSAWTFDPTRHLHFLHQSELDTADVNWKSPQALEQFTAVLRFWLERGISGFVITNTYLDHTPVIAKSTLATEEAVLSVLKDWRQVLGNYSSTHETTHRALGIQVEKRTPSEASPLYGTTEEPAADLVLSKPFELQPEQSNATSLRLFVQGTLDATPEGMWPSFVLGNALYPPLVTRAGVLLDGLNMVAALAQGTPVFYYGDELGAVCEEKPCKMPWNEEAPGTAPGVTVDAQMGNSSHLEVVRHSAALRDKLAVRLGSTVTSVLSNSTVFVMLRVRKGTPGYMAVVNGDGQQVTVNLAEASSHVPESGHVEVKSIHSTKVVQSKVKLAELALDPHEAVILQFVPIFE